MGSGRIRVVPYKNRTCVTGLQFHFHNNTDWTHSFRRDCPAGPLPTENNPIWAKASSSKIVWEWADEDWYQTAGAIDQPVPPVKAPLPPRRHWASCRLPWGLSKPDGRRAGICADPLLLYLLRLPSPRLLFQMWQQIRALPAHCHFEGEKKLTARNLITCNLQEGN